MKRNVILWFVLIVVCTTPLAVMADESPAGKAAAIRQIMAQGEIDDLAQS